MAHEHLATYLNDHLAGATMAIELLQHLERTHAGDAVSRFAAELRLAIESDREQLQALMEHLGIAESRTRQATAWMAEKLTRLKLRMDDLKGGEFRLFEALEALSLGIEGKQALWMALSATSEVSPSLQTLDYDTLIARADEQRERVELKRLELAPRTLAPDPVPAD
jgi:hypothetical protein